MKFKYSFVALAAGMLLATAAQAQKGKTSFNAAYNVALPTGSFADQLNNTSFRGFQASIVHGISNRFSIGVGTGFQDFYQKHPRALYKLSDGSDVSAVMTHSIQTIPLLVQTRYAFTPGAAVQPYAALGVGGNLITFTRLLGEFGGQEAKFGFAARPEAGLYIPFKNGAAGFNLGASYNIMPFEEIGFKNLNSLGIHAGISFPLGK